MHLRLDPLNYVPWTVLFAGAMATSWFAWSRGGRVERIAAAAYAFDWVADLVLTLVFNFRFHEGNPPLAVGLALDLGPAAVFLWLGIRKQNGWMTAAAIAQGLQMSVRAEALSLAEFGTSYAVGMALFIQAMSLVMMGSLLGSTLSSGRTRERLV